MTSIKRTALAITILSLLGGGSALAQSRGRGGYNQQNATRTAQTRTAQTRTAQTRTGTVNGGIRLTQRAKTEVTSMRREMVADIKDGATPFLEIIPKADHVNMHQTQYADYDAGKIAKWNVSGLKGGQLDLVTLLPVSGHVGWTEAQGYAKTNKYNLVVTHADGTQETKSNIAATGFVTPHDLSLKLKPGKTTIEFWPDGSGGVGGYTAGRTIELNWDGK